LKSFFWIFAILVIIVICWVYFDVQFKGISDLVNRKKESIQKYSAIEADSAKISDRLDIIAKIEEDIYSWPTVISEIQESMPSSVSLTSIKISSDKKTRSEISGIANSKSTVASLRNLLEDSDKFEYVNIEKSETSEAQRGKEIETFILTFSLSKGALNE
jgi:Tfp pilus assembly protein PilN